jgi:hypothetical protein
MWAGKANASGVPDQEAMFMINANGWLEWGPGGNADQDIFLSRTGANQLTLTDTFAVAKPATEGDTQPRIAFKHDGGGIHFGSGTSAPDVAITRPTASTLDVRPIAGPTVFAVDVNSKRVRFGAPSTAPNDADLNNSSISFWVDEAASP